MTDETTKIADNIDNLSKWVQTKLLQYRIGRETPEKQTCRTKEDIRIDKLIDGCLEYTQGCSKSHKLPLIELWADSFKRNLAMVSLTPEQFVQKVLAREKDGSKKL